MPQPGVPVTVTLETGYPFRDTLTYKVDAKAGVFFTLRLRIPSCAASATVNGHPAEPGRTVDVTRRWEGTSTVTVRLTFETKYVSCPDELFTVWRGPLLYALPIGEKWTPVEYERDGVARGCRNLRQGVDNCHQKLNCAVKDKRTSDLNRTCRHVNPRRTLLCADLELTADKRAISGEHERTGNRALRHLNRLGRSVEDCLCLRSRNAIRPAGRQVPRGTAPGR